MALFTYVPDKDTFMSLIILKNYYLNRYFFKYALTAKLKISIFRLKQENKNREIHHRSCKTKTDQSNA